jgi:hypothetical protein
MNATSMAYTAARSIGRYKREAAAAVMREMAMIISDNISLFQIEIFLKVAEHLNLTGGREKSVYNSHPPHKMDAKTGIKP